MRRRRDFEVPSGDRRRRPRSAAHRRARRVRDDRADAKREARRLRVVRSRDARARSRAPRARASTCRRSTSSRCSRTRATSRPSSRSSARRSDEDARRRASCSTRPRASPCATRASTAVHFDGARCGDAWPTEQHRLPLARDEVVFCKEFELGLKTRSHPPTLITLAKRALDSEIALARGARVLVATSGGPDSMALLDVLASLRARSALLARRRTASITACAGGAARELDLAEAAREARRRPFRPHPRRASRREATSRRAPARRGTTRSERAKKRARRRRHRHRAPRRRPRRDGPHSPAPRRRRERPRRPPGPRRRPHPSASSARPRATCDLHLAAPRGALLARSLERGPALLAHPRPPRGPPAASELDPAIVSHLCAPRRRPRRLLREGRARAPTVSLAPRRLALAALAPAKNGRAERSAPWRTEPRRPNPAPWRKETLSRAGPLRKSRLKVESATVILGAAGNSIVLLR